MNSTAISSERVFRPLSSKAAASDSCSSSEIQAVSLGFLINSQPSRAHVDRSLNSTHALTSQNDRPRISWSGEQFAPKSSHLRLSSSLSSVLCRFIDAIPHCPR